jgi:sarcosine oxidase
VEQVEIAIVGSGVMGSAAAWALAARGVPAVLLEQFELGHAHGSSHGANRIFRFSYPDPVYVRMAVAAREAWRRLEDEAGEELLVTTGGLDAGARADGCAAALSECGVPHSWLAEGDVAERFPGIAARPGERMLLQADGGVLLAGRAVAALQRLAGRDGASLRAMTPVLGIEPRGDGVVLRTPGGEILARVAIVTAGGWAGGLLGPALTRMPRLAVTVQQVRYYAAADPGARWPTFIEWTATSFGWYAVPVAGGAPGVKVAAHDPGRAVDPRSGPFTGIDAALEEAAARYAGERLPGLVPAALGAETCLYTMTADQDFLIDREGPIVVGGGGSGHAFKFGPLLGEILADLALGRQTTVPRDRFSLSRAALG